MREAHRSFRATRQKRPKIDLKARSKPLGAALALGRFTGRILECLRAGPGTLLDGSWPLLARPGRPKIGFGAAFGRPKPFRARPDAPPKRRWAPEAAQDRLLVNFWVDLGLIFVIFRAILRRFSLKPPATKTQNQNLKKESLDPRRASWLLRCAIVSYCPYVVRNGV